MNKLSKFFISAAIAGTVVTAASSAQALTLKQGSTGYNVRTIQTQLRNRGYFPRNVSSTGYYGSITKRAVMNFQRANGLRVDGIAGPRTLRVMGFGNSTAATGTGGFTADGRTGIVRVRTSLNMRSGPGIGYSKVGSLRSGQRVTIADTRNGWYLLQAGEGQGDQQYWVSSAYVRVR